MKHLLLTIALPLACMTAGLAQFQRGDAFVNGGFSLAFDKSDQGLLLGSGVPTTVNFQGEVNRVAVGVRPRFGVLLSPNLALGAGLAYEGTFGESEQEPNFTQFAQLVKTREHRYSVSPFLRYYKSFESRFGLWLDVYGGLSFGRQRSESTLNGSRFNSDSKLFGLELGIRPGLYYFISRRFALEASIGGAGYSYSRQTNGELGSEPRRNSSFFTSLTSGFGLSLGLSYFLDPVGEQ
ncbi:MAG: outer membrane beta-barrel protein [Lewinellaceae bacterium]|nr:outer membrane beta-barrel protein [Lewinellaceae bacterium]